MDREQNVQHFLDLIKKSRRGKFKIYIGMIAGVGKSYRMLIYLIPFMFFIVFHFRQYNINLYFRKSTFCILLIDKPTLQVYNRRQKR